MGGKWRQRSCSLHLVEERRERRGEERAITYAEMALLNRRELDSSVGVGVWREGDIEASAGVAQPAGAENETYRDGRKERGLLQFRSLAAAPAVAGGGKGTGRGSFGEGEYRPGRMAASWLSMLLGRKEPSVQSTPLPLPRPPPATFSVELGDSKGPFEKR